MIHLYSSKFSKTFLSIRLLIFTFQETEEALPIVMLKHMVDWMKFVHAQAMNLHTNAPADVAEVSNCL
jgi:hypothetical protein